MGTVFLTRRTRFSASHRLHNLSLSDQENREIYGKCNNPNGHGHNYELKVTVAGKLDENGMVMNLTDLKKVVQKHLIDKVDHMHLNFDVPFLEGVNPTSENLVISFWQQLISHLPDLYELELYETENNTVRYRGD